MELKRKKKFWAFLDGNGNTNLKEERNSQTAKRRKAKKQQRTVVKYLQLVSAESARVSAGNSYMSRALFFKFYYVNPFAGFLLPNHYIIYLSSFSCSFLPCFLVPSRNPSIPSPWYSYPSSCATTLPTPVPTSLSAELNVSKLFKKKGL